MQLTFTKLKSEIIEVLATCDLDTSKGGRTTGSHHHSPSDDGAATLLTANPSHLAF